MPINVKCSVNWVLRTKLVNPYMPVGTYMYRQRAKNSDFSDFDDLFSFGHQMGLCAKNYENLPSRFFLGINGLKLLIV